MRLGQILGAGGGGSAMTNIQLHAKYTENSQMYQFRNLNHTKNQGKESKTNFSSENWFCPKLVPFLLTSLFSDTFCLILVVRVWWECFGGWDGYIFGRDVYMVGWWDGYISWEDGGFL